MANGVKKNLATGENGLATKEEIITAVKSCAEKLGRAPSQAEFRRENKISWYRIYKHFRGMRQAVRAAGLEPGPRGGPLDENALVLDWAQVVRTLGRLPYRREYDAMGKHHSVTLHARIGWSQLAHRFVLLVREFHVENEWRDVVEVVVKKLPLLGKVLGRVAEMQQSLELEKSVGLPQALELPRSLELPRLGKQEHVADDPGRATETQKEERRPGVSLSQDSGIESDEGRGAAGQEHRAGMRLGKLVAAELAIQILMAAAGGAQHAAGSIQPAQQGGEGRLPAHRMAAHGPQIAAVGRVLYGKPLSIAAMAHAPTNEGGVMFLFGALAASLGFRVERIQAAFPDCEAKREIVPGKWVWVRIEFEYESRHFKEHRHDPDGCDVIVCWKHNWPDCPAKIEVIELSKLVG